VEQDRGRIKGAAFGEFLAWYQREFGRERLAATTQVIPIHVRNELELDLNRESLGILSSRWYPSDSIQILLDVIFASIEATRRSEMMERAADAVMQATLKGVYRVLFTWLATPERYARFADRLWRSYYDSGVMQVEQSGPTRAVCTVRDWHSHHPRICDINRAAAASIYRAMGCDGVVTRRECCVSDGAAECRFVTTWAARQR
jgi:hypothetical protein